MSRRRGLSLLEVLVSIVLLATAVWSLQVLYVGLMLGTRKADTNQEATAAFQTIIEATRLQVRDTWPPSDPPDPTLTVSGTFQEYTYNVTDRGRVKDPMDSGGTRYLQLKLIEIQMRYYRPDSSEPHLQQAVFSVAR